MIAEEVVEAALLFLLDTASAIGAVLSSIWSVIYVFLFGCVSAAQVVADAY